MIENNTFNQVKAKPRPVRHECSTCANMPSCWFQDQDGFMFDAVKDCWKPRPVPAYINNAITK